MIGEIRNGSRRLLMIWSRRRVATYGFRASRAQIKSVVIVALVVGGLLC